MRSRPRVFAAGSETPAGADRSRTWLAEVVRLAIAFALIAAALAA